MENDSGQGKSGVRLYVEDRQLLKQLQKILTSDQRFEILNSGDIDRTTDLVLFSLPADSTEGVEKAFKWIGDIANIGSASEIFLFSESKDPDLLVRAMRSGVREFFHLPLNEQELSDALITFRTRQLKQNGGPGPEKDGKIVVFLGSKGGTGVTTIAVNMAVGMSRENSVVLVDMNEIFGEIPQFLDLEPRFTWKEIIRNIDRIDSALLIDSLSRHESGVYVLPSPSHVSDENLATPDIMERLLRKMQRMFDFILIDAGQTLDPVTLRLLQISDLVCIVSILSVTCLSNTHKLLTSFQRLGYPETEKIKVIINRHIDGSSISIADAEHVVEHDLFWNIPNDYGRTIKAINNGKPFVFTDPKAKISLNFDKLIQKMLAKEASKKKRWWSLGR